MEAAVTFSNVSKHYKDKSTPDHRAAGQRGGTVRRSTKAAVDRVSFELAQGAVVSLLGPNGAGKTTALSMMLGLSRPTTGVVQLLGRDPAVAANRQPIGAMLQQVSMPQKVSVTELLNLFRRYYRDPLDLHRLLEMAGLESTQRAEAAKLSGGQQRRLQFALAMAGNPSILFLDEPTTGMDVSSRRGFWENLRQFARQANKTIVLTTHHLEEADAVSDRILLLRSGRIIADGTPHELKQLAGDSFVSFVAEPTVSADVLQALAGAEEVEWSGRHVRIRTRTSDAVLRTLIVQNFDIHDIQVSQGGLEDAFLSLTAEPDPQSEVLLQ